MTIALTVSYLLLASALAAGVAFIVRPRPGLLKLTKVLAAGVLLAQLAVLGVDAAINHRCALLDPHGVISMVVIGGVIAFAWAGRSYNSPRMMVAGLLLVFVVAVISAFIPSGEKGAPEKIGWALAFHIVLVLMGYSILALGCVSGILLIVRERLLKSRGQIFSEVPWPPLTTLERLYIRSIGAGIAFLIAGIALGVLILPADAWNGPWYHDIKVILSAVSCVLYGLVWVVRKRQGFSTPSAIGLSTLGFTFILIGLVAASLFPAGFHKF